MPCVVSVKAEKNPIYALCYRNHEDRTQTGHILGGVQHRRTLGMSDRGVSPVAFVLLRLLTHLSMLLGASRDPQVPSKNASKWSHKKNLRMLLVLFIILPSDQGNPSGCKTRIPSLLAQEGFWLIPAHPPSPALVDPGGRNPPCAPLDVSGCAQLLPLLSLVPGKDDQAGSGQRGELPAAAHSGGLGTADQDFGEECG